MPYIHIPPPGPKARAILEREGQYGPRCLTKEYGFVAADGYGCFLEDPDGNRYLDFTSGIGVNSLGHGDRRVQQIIAEQAEQLLHVAGGDHTHPYYGELCEKLAHLAPGADPKRVMLVNSGTEAVEAARKLATYHTGRKKFIACYGGFHGRTTGALAFTASHPAQQRGFTVPQDTDHIPYPDLYRGKNLDTLDTLKETLFRRNPPDEYAGLIIEPIQGEGGYLVPSAEYMQKLQTLCRTHGILFMVDEVQSGMGRTGKMFCSEHYGIEPDIMTLAKGIANGMPLGAMIAKDHVMNWEPGSHNTTFGGNIVACRTALEVIDRLENKGLLGHVNQTGDYMQKRMRDLQARHPSIGNVRGKGLMIGVELVKDQRSKERAPEFRDRFVQKAFENGLLTITCGPNAFRILPPLILTKEEADIGINIIDRVLTDMELGMRVDERS
ncbi:aspartate aminotransferase family protein, partial [Candidatus Peregrinibacteria bacterium CG22_combo_CG10-13_8_21_14_all_49_11]